MATIRPNALPTVVTVDPNDKVIVDRAASTVRSIRVPDLLASALPFATTPEAQAGIATGKPMDPLRTAAAINALLPNGAAGRAVLAGALASDIRTTLGLGGAAVLNVGTTAGTVAAGDDSRINRYATRNVPSFGGVGDGVTASDAAIAGANGYGVIWIPAGLRYRITANITLSAFIIFEPDAALVVDAGVTVTLTGAYFAMRDNQVFQGSGNYVLSGNTRSVPALHFGGSLANIGPGIQKAIDSGAREVIFPDAPCAWTTGVTLPSTGRYLKITMTGHDVSVGPFITALIFDRVRTIGQWLQLQIDTAGSRIIQTGTARSSFFIQFMGRGENTALTSMTRTGSTVTVNWIAHPYTNGQTVYSRGWAQPEYNGAFTITGTTANTFTFTVAGTPATPATGQGWFYHPTEARYEDNRVEIIGGGDFQNFFRVAFTRYCNGKFDFNSRGHGVVWEGDRASSFFDLSGNWLAGAMMIYYVDPLADGISNGIRFDRLYGVGNGIVAGGLGSVYIEGVQSILGSGNSIDLCRSGSACATFIRCDEVTVEFDWMASDLAGAPGHDAVVMINCFRSSPRLKKLVNHRRGVTIRATGAFIGVNMGNNIHLGTCDNVTGNLVRFDATRGCQVMPGWAAMQAFARTTDVFEFYGENAANYSAVGRGAARGAGTIHSGMGANSVIDTPLLVP